MIRDALDFLVSLGKREPWRTQIHGLEYADRALVEIVPPRAEPLAFKRLQGFVDFIALENESIDHKHALIHVEGPDAVRYFSTLDIGADTLERRDREHYAHALFEQQGFPLAKFLLSEEFVINAQTHICPGEELDRLLALVGNIAAEQVQTNSDDGISQTVAVRAGVTLKKTKDIVNPFKLAPHRTFPEVEQPVSPFILRARQATEGTAPQVALFECDNGLWQVAAVESVRAWLAARIQGVPILA